MYNFEKDRERKMILKFHYKNEINLLPLIVNCALKYYYFQAKPMTAVDIYCEN